MLYIERTVLAVFFSFISFQCMSGQFGIIIGRRCVVVLRPIATTSTAYVEPSPTLPMHSNPDFLCKKGGPVSHPPTSIHSSHAPSCPPHSLTWDPLIRYRLIGCALLPSLAPLHLRDATALMSFTVTVLMKGESS